MPDEEPRKSIIQGDDLKEVCLLMKLQQRAKQFDGVFRVIDSKLLCVYCNEKFNYKYKHLLHRHIWSKSHLQNKRILKDKLVTVKANYESDDNAQSNSDDNTNDEQVETKKVQKRRLTPQERIQRYVKEFGNVLKQEDNNLICTSCNFKLKHNQRSAIERHMASKVHERKVSLKKFQENGDVSSVFRRRPAIATAAQQEFNIELCKVFLVSGASISKLSHPIVQRFFNKYTTMSIPDQSTLRKRYLDIARTTLQVEARKLQQERLNDKEKTPQAKEQNSKKSKGNKISNEDPLTFTDEQLESMLLLKKEPKEEPIDESELEVKEQKLKKQKLNKMSSNKEDDPLIFTDEKLESLLLLKEEPMDQLEPTDDSVEDPLSLPIKEPREEPVEPKKEPLVPNLEPKEERWD